MTIPAADPATRFSEVQSDFSVSTDPCCPMTPDPVDILPNRILRTSLRSLLSPRITLDGSVRGEVRSAYRRLDGVWVWRDVTRGGVAHLGLTITRASVER